MATDRATWLPLIGAAFLACFLGAGCYNASEVQAFLQSSRAPISGVEYRVLPPDGLTITSTRVPEIDGFATVVRPDGKINLPLLGELYVADKTPKEIEQDIIQASMKYYEEADATVQVRDYRSRKLYVLGEVSRPGSLPWTGCDSLLDVLATAQPTAQAWPERILVIRGAGPQQGGYAAPSSLKYRALGIHEAGTQSPSPAEAGENADPNAPATGNAPPNVPHKLTVNLLAMVQHGDMANNILLKPNDIVYVQMNPIDSFTRGVERITAPIRALTNGSNDARDLQTSWKWIEHGFPPIGSSQNNLRLN